MDKPSVKCAMCGMTDEPLEVRLTLTETEDCVIVNCRRCGRMIYARRESKQAEAKAKTVG